MNTGEVNIPGTAFRKQSAVRGAVPLIFLLFCSCEADRQPARDKVVQLTRTAARNGQASWSPNGDQIAFVSNRSGGWQIWLMPPEEGEPVQMTSATAPVGWPSWALDASSILFYQQLESGYRLMNIDLRTRQTRRLAGPDWESFRPQLSPAGDWLLFDAVREGSNHDIYKRHLESDAVEVLAADPGYDSDARWSPAGESIVFHSDRGAGRFEIQVHVMTPDGNGVRQLTHPPRRNGYPSWSPNGQCIVYISELEADRDLWLMDRSGANKQQLTFHPGFDSDPVWSPAGGRILFTTDRFGGQELAFLHLSGEVIERCEE